MKSLYDEIKILGIIGMFVILFLIGTSILAYFLGALNDVTDEMNIPSLSVEFATLEYTFAFISLLAIVGATYYLFRQREKKKKFKEGN